MKAQLHKVFHFKDFFSFLRIWSHLLKKSLMANFVFCAVHLQVSATFPLALSIGATRNWSRISWRPLLIKVVFCEKVSVWWLLLFCVFRMLILLFISSFNLLFHLNKIASGISCFWIHTEIWSSLPIMMFSFT